jgi:hypothetical protein
MTTQPGAKMDTGFAGVSWHYASRWMKSSEQDGFPPQSPVLSVIQLKLQESLDARDMRQPARKIWHATLEYLHNIPGYTTLYWGTTTQFSHQIICLLIQWESPVRWWRFQLSMGVSLMLGLLAG